MTSRAGFPVCFLAGKTLKNGCCTVLVLVLVVLVFFWSPYVTGQTIIFLPCDFYLSFFFSSPNLSGRRLLPYFHTGCGLSANLRCRSETWCTWLTENTGRQTVAKNRHLCTIAQLCQAISSHLRHVSTIGKKLVKQQYLLHMSPLYGGPLAAEIISLVWGTPANFNGFRVLAALLHGTPVLGVSQTLRR